jgi:hypothetical protein
MVAFFFLEASQSTGLRFCMGFGWKFYPKRLQLPEYR